jgi:PHD/YefM family antitoxin component YafN of YafNO toxin-antitoxin module
MKETDGSDVIVTEKGKAYLVIPEDFHMDQLTDTGQLRRDGSRYYLAI